LKRGRNRFDKCWDWNGPQIPALVNDAASAGAAVDEDDGENEFRSVHHNMKIL
jgi:hypothetical protein